MAVAYSGGRDSTALLHATLAQARAIGAQVLALHVHHGLSPHADAWLAHCERQCQRWARRGDAVTFVAQRLADKPAAGESVEAWARQARYTALRMMAVERGATVVLLAHHQRDQAETLMLQALRGAGVAGLSGMPREAMRDGITWLRPWLGMPREVIDTYVRRHRLSFIDDDSNSDSRFARNRLRLQVWPTLTEAFPLADASLAAAAAWAQEATAALRELAAIDLATIAPAPGAAMPGARATGVPTTGARGTGPLDIDAWLQLSDARRSNALREWLRRGLGRPAGAALITRLLAELPACRSAQWQAGGSELRTHRGLLICRPLPATASSAAARETALSVRRAGTHALPGWGGSLRVDRVGEGGVPLAWLARLDLLPRSGAERFQAGIGRPPRSLKLQFQAAGLPTWERDGPLLFSGGQLVFVPGLGLDARVVGLPGQALVSLQWVPMRTDGKPTGSAKATG